MKLPLYVSAGEALKPGMECDFSTVHLDAEVNRANDHGVMPHPEPGEAVDCLSMVGPHDGLDHLHLCRSCAEVLLARRHPEPVGLAGVLARLTQRLQRGGKP